MYSYVDFHVKLFVPHDEGTDIRDHLVVVATSPLTGDREARSRRRVAAPDRLLDEAGGLQQVNPKAGDVQRIGNTLGRMLLPDEVGRLLREAYGLLAPAQALRLRLWIEDDFLIRCPWEFTRFDLGQGTLPLVLDEKISLVRHVWSDQQQPDLPVPDELTILSVDAGRVPGADSLAVELPDRLGVAGPRPHRLARVLDPTLVDVEQALRSRRPAVFHFSGHGYPPTEARDGSLLFHHPTSGATEVGGKELAKLLLHHGVSVAFISACYSGERAAATGSTGARAMGVAQALVDAGVPLVIGMQHAVKESSAQLFTKAVVEALVAGASVDEAVARGRRVLLRGIDVDFGRPVLYQRTSTGAFVEPFRPEDLGRADVPAERTWAQLQHRGTWWRLEAAGDRLSLHPVPGAATPPMGPAAGGSVHVTPDGTAAVHWRDGTCRIAWLNRLVPRLVAWPEPIRVLDEEGRLLAATTAGTSALRLAVSTRHRTLDVRVAPGAPPRVRAVAEEPSRAAVFLGGEVVTVSPTGEVREVGSGPLVPGLTIVTSLDVAEVGGRRILAAVGRDDAGAARLAVLVGGRLMRLPGLPEAADLVVVGRGADPVRGAGGIVTSSGAELRLHELPEQISR